MTISQKQQDELCVKLRSVGLPKEYVLPLVNSINRSMRAEGAENVVKRLKQLKQAAVNHMAGLEVDLSWIAHTATGPKGPWKPVWRWLNSASHKHRKVAFNTLMVYASFSLPKDTGPTKTQERKFLLSAFQEGVDIPSRNKEAVAVVRENVAAVKPLLMGGWRRPDFKPEFPSIEEYCVQINGSGSEEVRRSERIVNNFLGGHAGREYHAFPEVKAVLGTMGEDYFELTHPWNGAHRNWEQSVPSGLTKVELNGRETYDAIGVVGFSQEPGFKFRAFAAPNIVLQAALEPMKRYLLDYIRQLPWDCTHDQESGVADVQRWLQEGKTVYSVDLSDATNNFPLALTMRVLKLLRRFPESTLLLFENLSRSEYRLMWESEKRSVSWNVGQPLGTGPSFPAFALSHAFVALTAEVKAGIPEEESGTTFRILGDDFVTNHPVVHEEYRRLLRRLHCPVSEAKCLVSSTHAEFAGKLITSSKIYHGYKYKDMSNQSFMAVLRTLGRTALSRKFLTRDQYEYAKLVQEFPEPFGLGFNPHGKSYAERYATYLDVRERLDLEKSDVHRSTAAEMKNIFHYRAVTSVAANKMRWPAVEPDRVPKQSRDTSKVTPLSVMESIRDDVLKPVVIERGDPRPDPLLGHKVETMRDLISASSNRFQQTPSEPTPGAIEPDVSALIEQLMMGVRILASGDYKPEGRNDSSDGPPDEDDDHLDLGPLRPR